MVRRREREGKGREGKERKGKGREGKGREGKGREGKGRERMKGRKFHLQVVHYTTNSALLCLLCL